MKTLGWRDLFWRLLCFKIVYLAVVYFALWFWSEMDETEYFKAMRHWPVEGKPVFASHFATWDGAHYLYLSEMGYSQGVNSCAFYPLWPLLIRWLSPFTLGNSLLAGTILSNLFSLIAWVVFYQVVEQRFGGSVALWALVLLIVFPGSLFYQFIYSESLFLLLVMVLWFGLERRRYNWAWAAAFLLPLSRPVGIFCVLPIAWHLMTKRPLICVPWFQRFTIDPVETGAIIKANPIVAGDRWHCYGLLAAPVLGWAVYFALMWNWTGNPFEGIQAQRFWGVHSIANMVNVPKFLVGLFSPTELHGFRGSLLDRMMFIFMICTLPLVWKLGKDLMVWTYMLGIMPAMSGTFTSSTRYESTVFPMFIALAVFFTRCKSNRPLAVFVVMNILLHVVLLWWFVNFRWAG